MRTLRLPSLAILAGLLVSSTAMAAVGGGGTEMRVESTGGNVYAAGDRVTLESAVPGDALVGASRVLVSQPVEGDLTAAGGSVSVEAPIRGDARVGGGTVRIAAPVSGDLVIAGGTVTIERGASVGGDLWVFGGTIEALSDVAGDVMIRGGDIRAEGGIGGTIDVSGEQLSIGARVASGGTLVGRTLALAPSASFGGRVEYWREAGPMNIETASGDAVFNEDLGRGEKGAAEGAAAGAGLLGAFSLYGLLSGALLLLLITLSTKTFYAEAGRRLLAAPWMSLLVALLYFVLLPIAAVLTMVTVIGIPLGLFALFLWIFSMLFASPVAAMSVANAVNQRYRHKWGKAVLFFVALGVLALFQLLDWIPVLGWIAKLVIVLMGFGATLSLKWEKWRAVS